MAVTTTIASLSGFFGTLALLLATIGLYGIMAYNVARRRNEIGGRIALGAVPPRVIRMVLADARGRGCHLARRRQRRRGAAGLACGATGSGVGAARGVISR
jgi:hypothetical protein